jgi:hypothetical protein
MQTLTSVDNFILFLREKRWPSDKNQPPRPFGGAKLSDGKIL